MTKRKRAVRPLPRPAPVYSGKAKENLSANLIDWMENRDPKTVALLAKSAKVAKKTIYNMRAGTYDPMKKIESVARVYGKEAWMLLCPLSLSKVAEIIQVYGKTDDLGRHDIEHTLEIIKGREGRPKPPA